MTPFLSAVKTENWNNDEMLNGQAEEWAEYYLLSRLIYSNGLLH